MCYVAEDTAIKARKTSYASGWKMPEKRSLSGWYALEFNYEDRHPVDPAAKHALLRVSVCFFFLQFSEDSTFQYLCLRHQRSTIIYLCNARRWV